MFTPASSTNQRILALDALRGFALFGVLAANIFLFNSYAVNVSSYLVLFPDELNQLAGTVVKYFFRGRFYPIFSFLFGLGLGMQFLKLKLSDSGILLLFRRLLLLLIIGVLHYIFVWDGDILVRYALLGFVALAFLNRRKETILTFSALLYLLHCAYALTLASPSGAEDTGTSVLGESFVYQDYTMLVLGRSYGLPASYATISSLFYSIKILSFVLLGVYISKLYIFEKYSNKIRVWLWALGILVFLRLINAVVAFVSLEIVDMWLPFLNYVLNPAIYVCAFMVLVQFRWLQSITKLLAGIGKMSLTNYVAQNAILAFIFYGYGLQQYQQWSPWQLIISAAILFILQGVFSNWWLIRFKQGPLERLWRKLAATKSKQQHEVY